MPGLNDVINWKAGRGNQYTRVKKRWAKVIASVSGHMPMFQRAMIDIHFHEPNKKRDPDNIIGGGTKILLDGLVHCGVIPGDGWAVVQELRFRWHHAKGMEPGVFVHMRAV